MNKKPFQKQEKKVNKSITNGSIIDRFLNKKTHSNKSNNNNNHYNSNHNNNYNNNNNRYQNNNSSTYKNNNNNNNTNSYNTNNNDNINNSSSNNRKSRREFKKKESIILETLSKEDKDLYRKKQNLKLLEENKQLLTGKDSEYNREQLKKANSKSITLNESILSDLSQKIKKVVEQVKCYRDRKVILRRMDELKNDRQLTQYGKIEFKMFGSSSVDLALANSDIDMIMTIEKPLKSNQQRQWVYKMAQVLRFYGMERVQPIPFARVPIIKFYDPKYQFDCDITLTKDSGNTQVVREFCNYSPSISTLIIFLKHWASRHGLNDASLGTLSSYSITNMIIHILQLKKYLIPYCELKELNHQQQQELNHQQQQQNEDKKRFKKSDFADILIYFFQYYGYIFNYRYSMINIGQDSNDILNTTKPLEKSENNKDSINIGIGSDSGGSSDSSGIDSSSDEEGEGKQKDENTYGLKLSHNDTKDLFYIKDCVEGHNITRCIQRDKLIILIKEFQKAYTTLISGKLPI